VGEALTIAQVTPFAWEVEHEANRFVARVSEQLCRRGHRVVIVAPSQSPELVRETRRALREQPGDLLAAAEPAPVVLGVGEVLPFAFSRRRAASLPVDVARTIELALEELPLDIVHVHEPFAPGASSAALRHSRALNVGSFHMPTERVLSTQLARGLSRLLFGRLDARTVSYEATRELMEQFFPGRYQLLAPGAEPPLRPASPSEAPAEIVMIAEEERAALRIFLRALRALPEDLPWHATVLSSRALAAPATLSAALRERITFLAPEQEAADSLLARAQIAVLASDGGQVAPGVLLRALAAGAVPVASRLPAYSALLGEGEHGLEFEPGDAQTLSAHLQRLLERPERREVLRTAAKDLAGTFTWERAAEECEAIYGRLVARRHASAPNLALRRHLQDRRLIDVDLHMHTDHSHDCATPVEVLLSEAKAKGLGAIAVTDHNEISGALDAAAKAQGIKVIVGEEVKTARQGEVIGLFLREKIPRGLSLQDTIAEIRRQGGVVYVPHPFDRLHSVPDYENLLEVLEQIDALEIFNPRVAISEFNDEAVRFAAKYRIAAGAGSDSHVTQGLGSVRIRMRDFDGPEEFLESLRDADIVRNPASLLYVQALKFLQTKALPEAARKATRERRVRRAARKS
jgi:glycosyltransferase involved in cell wall biosynthesis